MNEAHNTPDSQLPQAVGESAAEVHQEQIKQLADLIQQVEIAMLTTEMPDGTLRSRPMATQNHAFDGTLCFLTDRTTPKIAEIEGHQQVNVSYAKPSANLYVSVSGRAEVIAERSEIAKFWTEAHKVWFPAGLDDPNLVLLKIQVEQAEYWQNNQLVTLFGMAKGYLTGQGYQGEGAEHAKLSLSGRS